MRFASIASGSSGNCIYVGAGDTHILVDAGISKKRIVEGLTEIGVDPCALDAILVTHEHSDHIQGLGVMSRKYPVPIYGTKDTLAFIRHQPSVGKIPKELFHPIQPEETFSIGDLKITPFSISHDAVDPVAYRFEDGVSAFAIATDLGTYDERIIAHLSGLDGVFMEANHDIHMLETGGYPYPLKRRISSDRGHLSNEASGELLCEIIHERLKYVVLGHLSRENNFKELAYETVRLELNLSELPFTDEDIHLLVARRKHPMEIIEL